MNNNVKIIILIVIVLGGGLFIKSQMAKVKMKAAHGATDSFCNEIQTGSSLKKVMDQVAESGFEQIEFKDTQGKLINAANKGTFSPAKWADFKSGTLDIWFQVVEPGLSSCEVVFNESFVTSKAVK